jgi:Bacteriophage, scaffolding protein
MTDEVNPSAAEGAPENAAPDAPPDDFRAYVKWHESGALPPKEEANPATAAEEPPVKTAPQSGADTSQQEDDDDVEERKPNGRVRRIDRLTRENEQLKQKLAALEPPKPAQAEPPKQDELGKPKLRDFETLEAYQEALTDWKLDQREAAKKAEAAQAEVRIAEEKAQAGWKASEKAARAAHADYDDIVESVKPPEGISIPVIRQALLEEESGAELLYYLGTHPDEFKSIAEMQPIAAVKAIGKLSAKLSPPSDGKPQPKVSNAPKPPAPLTRPAGNSKKDILDENFARADYRTWERERTAQLKGK